MSFWGRKDHAPQVSAPLQLAKDLLELAIEHGQDPNQSDVLGRIRDSVEQRMKSDRIEGNAFDIVVQALGEIRLKKKKKS